MTIGVTEMETPAAGKSENRRCYRAACGPYRGFGRLEIVDLDHRQRSGGFTRCISLEADIGIAARRRGIGRPEIGEAPPERSAVEGLGGPRIGDGKFEIIDPRGHHCLDRKSTRLNSSH